MKIVATALRIASSLACLIVLASFVMWGVDEGEAASQRQIAGGAEVPFVPPVTSEESARETRHEGPRELINDAADVLLRPFSGIVESSPNDWVQHGVPTLLALLAYGLLMRLLINYLPVRT